MLNAQTKKLIKSFWKKEDFTGIRFYSKFEEKIQEIKEKVNENKTQFRFFESNKPLAVNTASYLRSYFVRKGKQSQREATFHSLIKSSTDLTRTQKITPAFYFRSFYYNLSPFIGLKTQKPKGRRRIKKGLKEKLGLRSSYKSKKEGYKYFIKSFQSRPRKKRPLLTKLQSQIDTLVQSFYSRRSKQKQKAAVLAPISTNTGVQNLVNNRHKRAAKIRPKYWKYKKKFKTRF